MIGRRARWVIFALGCLTGACFGATPRASIIGPSTVQPGSLVLLDARASVADKPLRWKSINFDAPLLTFDKDGRRDVVAILPNPEAGKVYRVALIAIGVPDGAADPDADVAVFEITVTGGPAPPNPPGPFVPPDVPPDVPPAPPGPPNPPPTPSPTGLDAAVKVAVDGIAQAPAHKLIVTAALAKHYRAMASMIAAGAFAAPEAILAENRARLAKIMANNAEPWRPVAAVIKAHFDSEIAAGRTSDNPGWAAAFRATAAAMEAVR